MTNSNDNIAPGLCQCGCGAAVKGRFLRGHNNLLSADLYTVEDRGYTTPCWIWQRGKDKHGYGLRKLRGVTYRMHRKMYEDKYGPIPDGLEPDHLCEVQSCINPDHLEPVTHKVNIRRSKRAILTPEQVAEIKSTPRPVSIETATILGKRFGVAPRYVRNIIYGSRWKD